MGVTEYIHDVRGELKHTNWPTQKQAIYLTILVVVISLVVAAYLGALDYLFSALLKYFFIS